MRESGACLGTKRSGPPVDLNAHTQSSLQGLAGTKQVVQRRGLKQGHARPFLSSATFLGLRLPALISDRPGQGTPWATHSKSDLLSPRCCEWCLAWRDEERNQA